jgi:hypothetical protein
LGRQQFKGCILSPKTAGVFFFLGKNRELTSLFSLVIKRRTTMPSDNRPPYRPSNVLKFPLPGAHNKPGVVYVAKDCEPRDFLLQVMHDKGQHIERRIEAAKALLPFWHTIKPIKRS